jgi:hypothetical protein
MFDQGFHILCLTDLQRIRAGNETLRLVREQRLIKMQLGQTLAGLERVRDRYELEAYEAIRVDVCRIKLEQVFRGGKNRVEVIGKRADLLWDNFFTP